MRVGLSLLGLLFHTADLEAVLDSCLHGKLALSSGAVVFEVGAIYLGYRVVGGDDEDVMLEVDGCTFDFSSDSVPVCPSLDVVA